MKSSSSSTLEFFQRDEGNIIGNWKRKHGLTSEELLKGECLGDLLAFPKFTILPCFYNHAKSGHFHFKLTFRGNICCHDVDYLIFVKLYNQQKVLLWTYPKLRSHFKCPVLWDSNLLKQSVLCVLYLAAVIFWIIDCQFNFGVCQFCLNF